MITSDYSSYNDEGKLKCDYHLREDDDYGRLSRNPEALKPQVQLHPDRSVNV